MGIYKEILEIPSNIGYWLVRADGGRYYEDFLLNDFIAVSDNEITMAEIKEVISNSLVGSTIDHFKELYSRKFSDWSPQQIAHAASRTSKFIFEMKEGDLVLVPSKNSREFLLGIIVSEVYEITEKEVTDKIEVKYSVNPYLKRRKILWIKEIPRKDLSEKLYWVLSAHQTIFDLKDNKEQINQLLAPLYIQDNICHGVIKVNKNEGITASEWFELYSLINSSVDDNENVIIKTNVQSPGLMELISDNWLTVATVLIILSGVTVGEVNLLGFKIKGIFPYIQNHRKTKIEIEILEEERRAKAIENDKAVYELKKTKELWEKEKEAESLRTQLQITSFDAGYKIGNRTQMDNLDDLDED